MKTWKKSIQGQMSESFLLGSLLAVIGGFLDAYTYLCRGHVFANAQTGNIVLLGLRVAEGDWGQALYYLFPILAFVLGVITADLTKGRFRMHPVIHWRQITIGIEFLFVLAVAFLPRGSWDMCANIVISFVCSMQVESFRKMKGNAFATTMCTGNLRSATENLFLFFKTKDPALGRKSLDYYGIILFFIIGAVLGSVFTHLLSQYAILLCCLLLAAAFLIMFIREEQKDV